MAPAAKRPLRDAKQISRIGLSEFARFIPIQYAPELDHSHTLKGFRTAHPWPSKGPSITGQIVRYLNRTYHVLSTVRQAARAVDARPGRPVLVGEDSKTSRIGSSWRGGLTSPMRHL